MDKRLVGRGAMERIRVERGTHRTGNFDRIGSVTAWSEGADGAFRWIAPLAPQLESANNGLPAWFLMLAAHIFSMLPTTAVGIGTKSRSSAILSPFE